MNNLSFLAEKLLTFQSTSCWEIPYWPKAFQVLLYKQRNGASCILRMRNNCTRRHFAIWAERPVVIRLRLTLEYACILVSERISIYNFTH